MKRLVDTSALAQSNAGFSEGEVAQLYNGLDCCLTTEIWEEINRTYAGSRGSWGPQYDFTRALQAPYLDMMVRGFAVDSFGRAEACERLRGEITRLGGLFRRLVEGGFGLAGMNPASTTQLKTLFYDLMHLPEQWKSVKGVRHISVGRDELEKLSESYIHATPLINIILQIRDLTKQLEVFECNLDRDGRFRAGYNIVGTETGRPSSSSNAFGTGRNAQNIDPGLRHVFQSDVGFRLGQVDLEQVEARDVGFICGVLFGDWSFLDACEGGDLHTANAKRVWPELGWTGDLRADKKIAERIFYRNFSYRFMAKRGSHLSNYMGTAWTAARVLKVPIGVMEEFQARYCRGGRVGGREVIPAFPCIPRWWNWTITELQTKGTLSTLFGFKRTFLGRPSDPATHREAIAFQPQGTTAQRMNLGMWRVWRKEPRVGLVAQNFDSIVFQYREEENEDDIMQHVLDLIRVEIVAPSGRKYVVPGEAKVGWNWGEEGPSNPDGLRKWKLGTKDERRRTRCPGIM
jgi:DNA polymerase I-like protein with 3'-5' exonuclease and polymerase domains